MGGFELQAPADMSRNTADRTKWAVLIASSLELEETKHRNLLASQSKLTATCVCVTPTDDPDIGRILIQIIQEVFLANEERFLPPEATTILTQLLCYAIVTSYVGPKKHVA